MRVVWRNKRETRVEGEVRVSRGKKKKKKKKIFPVPDDMKPSKDFFFFYFILYGADKDRNGKTLNGPIGYRLDIVTARVLDPCLSVYLLCTRNYKELLPPLAVY